MTTNIIVSPSDLLRDIDGLTLFILDGNGYLIARDRDDKRTPWLLPYSDRDRAVIERTVPIKSGDKLAFDRHGDVWTVPTEFPSGVIALERC